MRARRRAPGAGAAPRRLLIALHRRLYQRQGRQIAATLGPESKALAAYRERYQRATRRFAAVVTYQEVVAAAAGSALVLVGDYHTLGQAQRNALKLCQALLAAEVPLWLGLEFVQGRFQRAVDGYLRGELSEPAFLRAIRYARLQPFDVWPNFRPLFELARKARLPVVALDSPAGGWDSLPARDRFAAAALAEAQERWPGRVGVALIGQLHLAPPHLPANLPRQLRKRTLTVYQNCESIYFTLEQQGKELATAAVRLSQRSYCLINTSPLVAQQSYLDWVEATASGERVETITPGPHFRAAARLLATFLDAPLPAEIAKVEVVSPGQLGPLDRMSRQAPRAFRRLSRRVLTDQGFCLPDQQAVYLAGNSLNRAAEMAARYLWHLWADADGEARGLVDAFYAETLEQGLGFFGSKVVNPQRKAQHRPQLLARLEGPAPEHQVAAAILAHQRFERGERVAEVQRLYNLRDPERFHAVTRGLGQVLGDKLYYALRRGIIAKAEVRGLFFDPFEEEGAALHTYLYLIAKVGRIRIPGRSA